MISLIATVLNEENNLSDWLDGILSQTLKPNEIIIVDGGSTDHTWELLLEKSRLIHDLKVFQHIGNISAGRNFAIKEAVGDIIVSTDAGCFYHKDWLGLLVQPIIDNKAMFSTTAFNPWFKQTDGLFVYLIAAATTPSLKEFYKDWLPSSRSVAFKKEMWQDVGGYPEWIPYCEDVVFDLKLKKIGFNPYFVRESLVGWRPRKNLYLYFRQLFNYTRSDGHGKLFYGRQLIRYSSYISLILLLILARRYSLWWIVPVVPAGCVYMYKLWLRFWIFSKTKRTSVRVWGLILLPFIIFLGDLAKMAGWPLGVCDRLAGKIRFQP